MLMMGLIMRMKKKMIRSMIRMKQMMEMGRRYQHHPVHPREHVSVVSTLALALFFSQ